MDSDTENVEYGVQIQETSTYPLNNNILYREHVNQKTKRSFSYVIIKEGIYPDKIVTRPSNKQKERTETLQDTSNIRRKRQSKQYKIPHGYVTLKLRTKTTLSGSLVFGLQLESV
ncbi:16747_t:CDS:2 [Funneliformis caledonium]|uniref:16747_t:CDS:1 n=1 Tax=Funneliformis caledonium TaxID=1117310 RepID=A0A9N9DJI5_9GLOM|nr:16747_t:CDS:2 [Funneliformis caledonium]